MKLHSISLHNIRRKKGKAAGIFFILTLAVTLTVALTVLARTTEVELQNSFDKVGSNMVIVPKSQDLALSYNGVTVPGITLAAQEMQESSLPLIKTIKNKESIAYVAPKLIGATKIYDKDALIVGVNFANELAMKAWWKLSDGQNPKSIADKVTDKEVIIGADAANRLGTKTGESIVIKGEAYKVRGVLESLGSEEDNVVFMDLHKAQAVLNKAGKVSFVEIAALCYTCPIEDIVAQVSEVLPDAKVTALVQSLEQRKQTVERFAQTARGVAAAILVISILIAANTVAAAINERRREIGIFRAIGFRKTHIARIVFTELGISALFAALAGGAIGALTAFIVAPVIMDLPLQVKLIPSDALLAMLVSLGTALAASLYPMLKVMRLNPADALRTI